MQVRLTTESNFHKSKTRSKSDKSATGSSSISKEKERSPFLEILDQVIPVDREESKSLHELWSNLPDAEKSLIEEQSEENIQRYKNLVMSIAKTTIEQNMQLQKMYRQNRHQEKVELTAVKIIDERIHKMLLMISSPRNSAFSILKSLEDIRGMLMDLKQ